MRGRNAPEGAQAAVEGALKVAPARHTLEVIQTVQRSARRALHLSAVVSPVILESSTEMATESRVSD